ncbi:hypothetical protein EGW08_011730 [Elysia chlorotica]|uniref:Uncharacterized protein n=1 Tax=Elysia chlorotica TaxID=188477 RepID=A0A3S1HJ71_ELYCH|nr:hypothetical protein EGW08_011730 [Elysia chlorotica]
MTPTGESSRPGAHSLWDTELQGGPSLAHKDFSLDDNQEVVMGGSLNAAAREDVDILAVNNAWRTTGGLSTTVNTSQDCRPIDVFTLEKTTTFQQFKDTSNQTDTDSETCFASTSGHAHSTCVQGGEIQQTHNDNPPINSIFNVSQRYAWNENSSLTEDSSDISKRKHPAIEFYSEKAPQSYSENDSTKNKISNICAAIHSPTVNDTYQNTFGEATLKFKEAKHDGNSQVNNVQPRGNNGNQIETANDFTHSCFQMDLTRANKKIGILRTHYSKTETPSSSVSSPVSTSTDFVFHGHSPYTHQETRTVRTSQPLLAADHEDSPAHNRPALGAGISTDVDGMPCSTTAFVSLTAEINTPESSTTQEDGYTKGSETMTSQNSGSDSKIHVYAPCTKTDDDASVSNDSPKKSFNNYKECISQTQLPSQTEDDLLSPAGRKVSPVTECLSDPPSYDEIVKSLPPPGSNCDQHRRSASEKPADGRSDHKDMTDEEMIVMPFAEGDQQLISNNPHPKLIFQHKRRKRGKD